MVERLFGQVRSGSEQMNKRIAVYVDTPLHVLNALNFVWHDIDGIKGECDLYIFKQFSGFEMMIPRIADTGLFKNVYECHVPDKTKESKCWHYIKRAAEILRPSKSLREWTNGITLENRYDTLLIPGPFRFTIALNDVNRNAEVRLLEDGSVNYYGNLLDAYGPKSKWFFKTIFNRGHNNIQPQRMYVNNLAMCESTLACEKLQLPRIDCCDVDFCNFLTDVFGPVPNGYEAKFIFMSIPVNEIKSVSGVDPEAVNDRLLEELTRYRDRVIVRPHPREIVREYMGLNVETDSYSWELFCSLGLDESNVLIGVYSTGMFMPKLMFDKEPTLIFTYKLYKYSFTEERFNEMESLIRNLKDSYSDKNRVYNVESFEEYQMVLKTVARDKHITI